MPCVRWPHVGSRGLGRVKRRGCRRGPRSSGTPIRARGVTTHDVLCGALNVSADRNLQKLTPARLCVGFICALGRLHNLHNLHNLSFPPLLSANIEAPMPRASVVPREEHADARRVTLVQRRTLFPAEGMKNV